MIYFSPFWLKNDRVEGKKFTREKFYDSETFDLKYVLKHSESIPAKKNFEQSCLDFVIFSLFWAFGRKTTKSEQKNFSRKKFRIRDFWFKIRFETF